MKNEFSLSNSLRKALSVMLCAAMIISAFMPASAALADTDTSGDGTVTYRAVLIGNTYPGTINELDGPDNDILNFSRTLKSLYVPYTTASLTNATIDETNDLISSTFADADEDDVSLFFYSGHGDVADESSTYDGALCMLKETGMSIDDYALSDLESKLSEIPGKVVVILDSCGSGAAITEDPYSKSSSSTEEDSDESDEISNITTQEEAEAFTESAYEVFANSDATVSSSSAVARYAEFCQDKYYVIAGCEVSTYSYTIALDDWGEFYAGALTYSIIYSLGHSYTEYGGTRTGRMSADTDQNNQTTLDECYECVKPFVDHLPYVYDQNVVVYPEDSTQVLFEDTNISQATVSCSDLTYTGSQLTASPVVKVWSTTLTKGTDYTLDGVYYSDSSCTTETTLKDIGTYYYKVTGTGDYTGSKVGTVNVTDGSDSDSGSVTVDDNTYEITGSSTVTYTGNTYYASSVTIPATVKINGSTYKVTSIASGAFSGDTTLKKVTIGKNVTVIGKNAFKGCTSLKTVNMKNAKIKKIGAKAFYNCKKLKTVKINVNKLNTVGSKAFGNVKKTCKFKVTASSKAKYKKAVKKLKKAGAKKCKFSR